MLGMILRNVTIPADQASHPTPPPGPTLPGPLTQRELREHGAGAASMRRKRGVSAALELRHCCVTGASAQSVSVIIAA